MDKDWTKMRLTMYAVNGVGGEFSLVLKMAFKARREKFAQRWKQTRVRNKEAVEKGAGFLS